MGQPTNEKKASTPYLRLVAIDGLTLPHIDLDRLGNLAREPEKRSLLQQIFLDFAYACELYYPMQQFARGEIELAK